MSNTLSVNIPFCGFYESLYSQEIDNVQEQQAEWCEEREREEGIAPELRLEADDFSSIFYDVTDYHAAYAATARTYADAFCDWFSEEVGFRVPMEFEEMTSPRFYNFETDRIFVRIPFTKLARLYIMSKREGHARLKAAIEERFTSYDGFHSFYSNDLDHWLRKPLREWDHNELGTLLMAHMTIDPKARRQDWEWEVFERVTDCDGLYHEWESAIDWQKYETKVAEAREEKLALIKQDDPDFIPPEPRCPYTLDLFI